MSKFELGNPSDECYLFADDAKIAAACILFLGNGQYFCTNKDTGEPIYGTFFALGGDVEETWNRLYGIGFEEFISKTETKKKMVDCYDSFIYARTRTSINDIGKAADELARDIERSLKAQS